jgi:signal transduction histidine kinase
VFTAAAYDRLAGLCGGGIQFAGTAGALLLLAGLDLLERHHYGRQVQQRGAAVGLLLARILLVELVVALDCSGTASLLRLLVVFSAHFAIGPGAARAIAALYAIGLVVRTALTVSAWWSDPPIVSGLLMSTAGLVIALVTAILVARLDESRASAERLVADLEESRARLRTEAAHAVEAAAMEERNHVARDIHDGLGHHLTAVSVQLQKAALFIDRDPVVAGVAVAGAQEATAQALADVRRSVGTLREADMFDLRAALAALARPSGDAEPRVDLELSGVEEGVDAVVLLSAYRVVQEALTNARRHAVAARVGVQVALDPEEGVRILVADDGRGFDLGALPPASGDGARLGLRGMAERVELLGGTLLLDSEPDEGTSIRIWLPAQVSPRVSFVPEPTISSAGTS